jgi:LacI family transcriptional regulator
MPEGAATILDIARESGVDNSTVSLALRGNARIPDKTRQRILEVASRLNYTPNQSARALSRGRSRVIGIMLSDLANQFFGPYIDQIQLAAEEHNLAVSLKLCAWDLERQSRGILQFCESRVDGIVWAPVGGDQDVAPLLRRIGQCGAKCVLMGIPPAGITMNFVHSWETEALKVGAEHLRSLNHQRIGIATATGVPSQRGVRHVARLERMVAAIVEAGGTVDERHIFRTADNSYGGVELAGMFARTPVRDRPTAIFAADDMLARALIAGLLVQGLRVPQDVSVLGYDDAPGDGMGIVPLTSVGLDAVAAGRRIAELIIDLVEGKAAGKPPQHIMLHPRVAERSSCARISA